MRGTMIMMLVPILLSACYQSTARSHLSADGGDLMDVRYDTGDVRDALDTQDGSDVLEDETCELANLVLKPVSCSMLHGPCDCVECGVLDVRVLLFQGVSLVLDETLPNLDDTVEVGPVAPGSYELAAIKDQSAEEGRGFATGWERLRALYPDMWECSYPDPPCAPLSITLLPCTTSFVPLDLECVGMLNCDDCCGF
jgi:hypothetical protein